ncbi:MAG TPA: tRNA lysidine(34) synthetase TilS [Anaerolineae bacterium]
METNTPSHNREQDYRQPHPTPNDSCIQTVYLALRQFFGHLNLAAPPPTPLLLAVSGGPDSLCMADAIITLHSELHIAPVIAHLNHQLRGEAARADADFVRAYAAQMQVPCIVEQVDVLELSRTQRISIEVAAREARYRFLASAAQTIGAQYITVAHNADDQVETVLLRLLRGTGINGLRGMRPVHPLETLAESSVELALLRPLLSVNRTEIECYCRLKGLTPRYDATNSELHHTRNRIRHELLPLLEQYNPGVRKVLVRLAETASTDMETIEFATRQAFQDLLIAVSPDQPLTLDRVAWRTLPVGLQRATLREAVRRVKLNLVDLKFAGVEETRDILNGDARTAEIAILNDIRIVVKVQSFMMVRLTSYN